MSNKNIKKSSGKFTVLVGVYNGNQLQDWQGYYNYPITEKDEIITDEIKKINELWLFDENKSQKYFSAVFLGIKNIDELIHDFGYKPNKKSNVKKWLLFKTEIDNSPKTDCKNIRKVIVRLSDFLKPKIKSKLGQHDLNIKYLTESLPEVVYSMPDTCLCVGESAIQYNFLAAIYPEQKRIPTMEPIRYVDNHKRKCFDETIIPNTPKGCAYRMGEFFCGPGGLACGALNATIENPNFRISHAWANDYDQQTCDTYAENICPENAESVICEDVRKLDLSDKRLTEIDGFAFGFPCNDFSVVGEHKGFGGDYGPLYQYGVAALKKFKPLWFLAENVGGLASANEGKAFKIILDSLQEAGYRIYPHLYKFEDYGVPQTRHRIIIIGIRKDQPFVFYPPSPKALEKRDNSSRNALENPPIPSNAPNNVRSAQNKTVVERLSYIRPGQNAFTADLPSHLRLNVKGAKISQIYKRLDPDKPAYTVTGSGGGGTHIYHYSEPRALTNRERARLQTFPDDFLFTGTRESVRKQIGMAVPPRGAQIIFEALLRTLAGIEYEHIECNISNEGTLK